MGAFTIGTQEIDELNGDELLGLLDQGVNALYVTEAKTGRIVYVNDRACETTQYDRDELLGAHVSTIEANIKGDSGWQSFVEELRETPQYTIRSVHERKDTSTFPVEVDLDLLEHDGRELVLTVIRPLQENNQKQGKTLDTYSQYFPLFKHSPISLWNFDLSDVYHQLTSDVERTGENLPDDETIREYLFTRSRLIEVNNSTLELFDAEDKQEILGNFDTILTPRIKDQLIEIFRNLVRGNYNQEFEMEPRTVNGELLSVLTNYMVPPNSRRDLTQVFVSLVDITPRRDAQEKAKQRLEKLEESEKKFRQLAENIREVFWLTTPDKNEMLYISPAYEEIWGRSTEEIYEKPLSFLDAVHPGDEPDLRERLPKQKENKWDEEFRIIRPDGDVRWIWSRAFPVRNDSGEVYRIAGIAEDITEKKTAQQELEESLEEKKTLLGEIHHRVKNNMQIVASLLKMQVRRLDSEKTKKALEESIKRVKSMALIHEKLYRTDRLADFDLGSYLRKLCEHLVDFHSTEFDDSNLQINIDPINLDLDTAIACGLIVNELVNNSLEHGLPETKEGRLEISLDEPEANQCRLIVADNGPGWEDETEFEEASRTGLEILDALVRYELDGSFAINASEGFEATVCFEP